LVEGICVVWLINESAAAWLPQPAAWHATKGAIPAAAQVECVAVVYIVCACAEHAFFMCTKMTLSVSFPHPDLSNI